MKRILTFSILFLLIVSLSSQALLAAGERQEPQDNAKHIVEDLRSQQSTSSITLLQRAYGLYRAGERGTYGWGSGSTSKGKSKPGEGGSGNNNANGKGKPGGDDSGKSDSGSDNTNGEDTPKPGKISLAPCEGLNEEDAARCVREFKRTLGIIDTLTDAFCGCRADGSCEGVLGWVCGNEVTESAGVLFKHPVEFLACKLAFEKPSENEQAAAAGLNDVPQVYIAAYQLPSETSSTNEYYFRIYTSAIEPEDTTMQSITLQLSATTASGDTVSIPYTPRLNTVDAFRFSSDEPLVTACLSFSQKPRGVSDYVCTPILQIE